MMAGIPLVKDRNSIIIETGERRWKRKILLSTFK